jgi:glycine/D-amino acid oxidase-like deaminating enzyme
MVDVAVMGAGVLGLSAAWELARRGLSVAVVEAAHPGAGASGGLVGALAPHAPEGWTPTKALQLEALLAAEGFWAQVAAVGGVDPGFARVGRLQPIPDAAALARAEARVAAARALWGGRADMRLIRTAEVAGWRLPGDWALHDTLTARIAPRRALVALAAALGAQGVAVANGTAPPAGAAAVVWATGAAGLAAAGLGGPEKGQAALLALDRRGAPVVTAPGLYVVPHADGTVAVGSTSERDATDPIPDGRLDALLARARALLPDLAAAPVIARWAGLRPRAATRQPVLGPWPGRPGHWLLNGGFKTGFALAPLLAALLADRIATGTDRIPPEWRP